MKQPAETVCADIETLPRTLTNSELVIHLVKLSDKIVKQPPVIHHKRLYNGIGLACPTGLEPTAFRVGV